MIVVCICFGEAYFRKVNAGIVTISRPVHEGEGLTTRTHLVHGCKRFPQRRQAGQDTVALLNSCVIMELCASSCQGISEALNVEKVTDREDPEFLVLVSSVSYGRVCSNAFATAAIY